MSNISARLGTITLGPYADTNDYTPSPRVATARIMAGVVGQIYIHNQIVWESKPYKTHEKAHKKAVAHRLSRLIEQFS